MKIRMGMGTQISGSLAGVVAGHNKGGQYLRNRSIPTNPNTARQQTVRSLMGMSMEGWSDILSEGQRQAWRDWAANVEFPNAFGDPMNISGVNAFVRYQVAFNQLLVAEGNAPVFVEDAPVIFDNLSGPIDVSTFEADFTTGGGSLNLVVQFGEAEWTGEVVLYIAPPQPAGVRFYKGPYQLAASTAVSSPFQQATFTIADLSDPEEWFSDTVPVAGWDGLFVPLRIRGIGTGADPRLSQEFRQLVQFSDVTP